MFDDAIAFTRSNSQSTEHTGRPVVPYSYHRVRFASKHMLLFQCLLSPFHPMLTEAGKSSAAVQ
jgi:hypothetical protein